MRASLRDVREAAFRALSAHGASRGEARAAAEMVLDAEVVHGVGLAALVDDLEREPWNRTPVEIAPVTGPGDGGEPAATGRFVLGSASLNRLLREGPLAVELLAGDSDVRAVGVPCAVAAPSLLDELTLEIARISGTDVTVVIGGSPSQLRVATPDGDVGVSTAQLPSALRELLVVPGMLAVRDVERVDLALSWVTSRDRVRARAAAAERGMTVEADLWRRVYDASRRYLVPG
ncbi:MAG: hypothetical protein L0H26_02775 [Microlunatus sp.]|nr:hypothetical protein [Microlunatus sp.]